MSDFYGHPRLVALKAQAGFLCYHWAFSPYMSVVLFTDAKTAKEWMKVVNKEPKRGWQIEALVTTVSSHPVEMRATINPSSDSNDIARIMSRAFYQNW